MAFTMDNLRKNIIIITLGVSATAAAQINSVTTDGYVARAEAMTATANWQGALDQLNLGHATSEEAVWLKANDELYSGHIDRARQLLRGYLAAWPASVRRTEAFVALCDCDFYQGLYELALHELQNSLLPHDARTRPSS